MHVASSELSHTCNTYKTPDDVRTSVCVFKMLTGQGQGRRHFRAKHMHWEEGRVKWNREQA